MIGANISNGQKINCLPCAGFFLNYLSVPQQRQPWQKKAHNEENQNYDKEEHNKENHNKDNNNKDIRKYFKKWVILLD